MATHPIRGRIRGTIRTADRRQRAAALVLPLLALAASAGCGSAGGTTVTHTVTVRPAASTGSQSTSSPVGNTGTSSSPAPRCRVGQLSVRQVSSNGAAGSIHLDFAFSNRSQTTCSLYGYPGLGLLDASGQPMTTHVLRQTSVVVPAVPERRVVLAPGARAWFYGGYSDVSSSSCPAAARLEVTPPDAYAHLTTPTSIAPCGGVINVSPVFAGKPAL